MTNISDSTDQPPKPKAKKKHSINWILWWIVDKEEIEQEVAVYNTRKFFKTSRGASVGCLLFSAVLTIAFIAMGNIGPSAFIDAAAMAILAGFIALGHRWAMILAMALWTFEKIALFPGTDHPQAIMTSLIWWSIYMHAFYMAFRVEQARHKRLESESGVTTGSSGSNLL